jgi:hypothetical protein
MEKDTIAHQLEHGSENSHHDALASHGFAAESEELPKGYFTSFYFIGSMVAVSDPFPQSGVLILMRV